MMLYIIHKAWRSPSMYGSAYSDQEYRTQYNMQIKQFYDDYDEALAMAFMLSLETGNRLKIARLDWVLSHEVWYNECYLDGARDADVFYDRLDDDWGL
jgi:hypothetical protein